MRGKVAVSATDEEGRVHRSATLDDGDYFGEIALLSDTLTTATVETLVPSIFIILQREQLQKLMHQHAELGDQIRYALKRRIAETDAMTA
jgi:CRP-like cAMP-binding protein